MYKCNNCNKEFNKPDIVVVMKETYYGVSRDFNNGTPMELKCCPHCSVDNDFEKIGEEVEEDD